MDLPWSAYFDEAEMAITEHKTEAAGGRRSRKGSGSAKSPRVRATKAKSKDSRPADPNEDEESFFGDFCLNCGEPCTGPSAYCSELCRNVDATDAALATQHYIYSPALSAASVPALISSRPHQHRGGEDRFFASSSGPPSAISSSPTSSLANSPLPSDLSSHHRLALLSSGPLGAIPMEEEVTDLDLGEGVLSVPTHAPFSANISSPRDGFSLSHADLVKLGGTPGKSPGGRTVHSPARLTDRFLDGDEADGLRRSVSPADTMTASSLPPGSVGRDSTVGRSTRPPPTDPSTADVPPVPTRKPSAGLPLFFGRFPLNHHDPEATMTGETPTSPATKATASRPSVTTATTGRREPSRPADPARGGDPVVSSLAAVTATNKPSNVKVDKPKDAKASLVAALGVGGPALASTGRTVSDIVSPTIGTDGGDAEVGGRREAWPMEIGKRRQSAPVALGRVETMSSSATSASGGGGGGKKDASAASQAGAALGRIAADWQGRIRGVLGAANRRARAGTREWEEREDEMTGVAMSLDKSTDSLSSSRSQERVVAPASPVARRAHTSPVVPRRSISGKASTSALEGIKTDPLPTPSQSPSIPSRASPVTTALPHLVAFASPPEAVVERGRSRRRGAPSAAMRSRSPDRSLSQKRPLSAGPESRRKGSTVVVDEEIDEEGEEVERGRGRARGGTRSSQRSLSHQLALSRPVGQYRDGYGYYS